MKLSKGFRLQVLLALSVITLVILGIAFTGWHLRSRHSDWLQHTAEALQLDERNSPPTISKETTFFTEPINSEGFVDYFAALNRATSERVTVDNNIVVLLFKAGIGLSEMSPERRQRYSELLGISSSDVLEPGFQILDNWYDEQTKQLIAAASNRPQFADQFPEVRAWTDLNGSALSLIIEGTHRRECYVPIIAGDDEDDEHTGIPLEFHQLSRHAARCLVARAMFRMAENKTTDALEDLLACHRLGRLVGRTPYSICGLVGQSIEMLAFEGEAAILRHGKISAQEALGYQSDLRQLPSPSSMIDKFGLGDRLMTLDTVMKKERGIELIVDFLPESSSEQAKTELRTKLATIRDESLRRCNQRISEIVDAGRLASFPEQRDAIGLLITKLRERARELGGPENVNKVLDGWIGRDPNEVGRDLGDAYFTFFCPAIDKSVNDEVRTLTRNDLSQVGFALAAYHADHRSYPKRLEALIPKYLSEIPRDRFNEQSLHYVIEQQGYLLYSVGVNGIDDYGRDFKSAPRADDISLRIDVSPNSLPESKTLDSRSGTSANP